MITATDKSLMERVRALFATILPMGTRITVEQLDDIDVKVNVAGTSLRVRFAGPGDFRGVQMALKARPRPDVIAASRLSLAAQQAITRAGINWADERGAASIEAGSMVIALSGQTPAVRHPSTDWTPAAIGIVEAVLSGTTPTAEAVAAATGHSLSTAVRVLAFLVGRGLLRAPKARGPQSGRRIVDFDRLLDQFSEAAHQRRTRRIDPDSISDSNAHRCRVRGCIEQSGHAPYRSTVRARRDGGRSATSSAVSNASDEAIDRGDGWRMGNVVAPDVR